ncbi:MAG: MFS transporter [Solirubrobacterales bacterium]|nr:MFS transporter [Solirubrobacterales bacterium]
MRRLLLLVAAIVFVDTMFYAVVAPLLPTFEEELGLSKASAGILMAAYPAGTLLGAVPSGLFAVRFGPRRAVLLGLALLGTSSIAFAVVDDVVLLDAARFVQGLGGACSWAGGLAWLIAEAPAERRGELIGAALGAAIGGGLFGPVLGAVAGALGTEPVFGAVAVVAAALAGWALATPAHDAGAAGAGAPLRDALRSRRVLAGMWLVALPALGFGVLDTLAPLRMDDLGASDAAVAAMFLVAAAVEALISPVIGRVSDRRGRLVPIRAGLLGAALMSLVVQAPEAALGVAALLVVMTAALGTFWAPAMALLSDAAEASGVPQGLAFGLVNLAWALGMVTGAGAGGAVAEATADLVPYSAFALLCAGTLVAVLRGADRADQGFDSTAVAAGSTMRP